MHVRARARVHIYIFWLHFFRRYIYIYQYQLLPLISISLNARTCDRKQLIWKSISINKFFTCISDYEFGEWFFFVFFVIHCCKTTSVPLIGFAQTWQVSVGRNSVMKKRRKRQLGQRGGTEGCDSRKASTECCSLTSAFYRCVSVAFSFIFIRSAQRIPKEMCKNYGLRRRHSLDCNSSAH